MFNSVHHALWSTNRTAIHGHIGGKCLHATLTCIHVRQCELAMRGYTYKSREEVIHHIGIDLAHEFHKNAYDALTHNCNHFSHPAAQAFAMLQFYVCRLKRARNSGT